MKCKQVNILPLALKFDLNDLVLFHKIIHDIVPISLPPYLKLFEGQSRLRSTHLDELSYVSDLIPRGNSSVYLDKSFFHRTHSLWNALPYELREMEGVSLFKSNLVRHMWDSLVPNDPDNSCLEDFNLSDND